MSEQPLSPNGSRFLGPLEGTWKQVSYMGAAVVLGVLVIWLVVYERPRERREYLEEQRLYREKALEVLERDRAFHREDLRLTVKAMEAHTKTLDGLVIELRTLRRKPEPEPTGSPCCMR